MNFLFKLLGDSSQRFLKRAQPIVKKINSLEEDYEKLTADDLRAKTQEFKERHLKGESLDSLLPEAFALVREAAKRTLGQRHFDVQLLGGIVLHQGKIAEMKTGEGKTLTATLAAYLNALEGKGVHIVTVNEYLAKRDTVWMGQIFHALGLSVGCITYEGGFLYDPVGEDEKDKERDLKGGFKIVRDFLKRCSSKRDAYLADITYGTNNEFGFDYLRDHMVYNSSEMVQRELNFAIIDEVDSILIDEARVPLIISSEPEDVTEKYRLFASLVSDFQKDKDYEVDEKLKTVFFTERGQEKVTKRLKFDPWLENDITTLHQLDCALKAKVLFLKERDYLVKDGKVLIIDEFTGRILPGRRWSGGLHQAIEAKEGVPIQPETNIAATITFQNYFRMYKKIAGMTGTAATSAEEFDKVYRLQVVVVPPNKPMIRKDLPDVIFKTEEGKFKAIVREVERLHKKGQPILVGTRSVEKNEYLSSLLTRRGIPHNVLNAKNHEREGEIIAQAGKKGAVTIATNMAGRGVDIILGGNPSDPQEAEEVKRLGGLHVIGTERHEARRIDNQLRGRAGRQGDPGSSQFFLSLEDDLLRIFGGEKIKTLFNTLKVPDDEPIQSNLVSGLIESAQQKIEGFYFDARHHLLEYDDVLNKHREIIYKKRREFLLGDNLREKILVLFEKFNKPKAEYERREKEVGEKNMRQFERIVCLRVIDILWMEHLSYMEHLRESVKLYALGGGHKDPLVEYKREGYESFQQLLFNIEKNIVETLLYTPVQIFSTPQVVQDNKKAQKIGRNEPCWCGSGKKFKKCHGK